MKYRIREIRESKGIPQYMLSQKSGVSRTTIQYLENKEGYVTTTKTLEKIAEALGVEMDDIFFAGDA